MTKSTWFSMPCSRCSRTEFSEIKQCSSAAAGFCTFKVATGRGDGWNELRSHTAGLGSGIGWLSILLFLVVWFFLLSRQSQPRIIVTTVLLLVGYAVIGGFFGRLIRFVTIWHQETGELQQRTSLFGITVRKLSFAATSRVSPHTRSDTLPDLPFSMAAFTVDQSGFVPRFPSLEDAITLLQFTMMGLLIRGDLHAARGTVSSSLFMGQGKTQGAESYLLFSTNHNVAGKLENRLVSAIRQAGRPLTVFQAARALYGQDSYSPVRWLLDCAIEDAVEYGVLQVAYSAKKSLLRSKRDRVNPASMERYSSDRQVVRATCDGIYTDNPNLQKVMRNQIKAAIGSRTIEDAD